MLLVTLYCIWPFNKHNICYLHSSIKCTSSFLNVKKWNETPRILRKKCHFLNMYTFENQVFSHGIDFLKVILNISFSNYFMICNQNNVCVNVVYTVAYIWFPNILSKNQWDLVNPLVQLMNFSCWTTFSVNHWSNSWCNISWCTYSILYHYWFSWVHFNCSMFSKV